MVKIHASLFSFLIFYSQLDTLSKDDLIKFAKKQMAVMQKMKGRCAGSSSLNDVKACLSLWTNSVCI